MVLLGARAKLLLPQQPEQGSLFRITECAKSGAIRRPVPHCWAREGTWRHPALFGQHSVCSSLSSAKQCSDR